MTYNSDPRYTNLRPFVARVYAGILSAKQYDKVALFRSAVEGYKTITEEERELLLQACNYQDASILFDNYESPPPKVKEEKKAKVTRRRK